MSDGLPRAPVANEIDLIQEAAGYVYSVIFWGPSQLGLPLLPPIFAKQVTPGQGVPLYRFTPGRGNFS